MTTSRSVPNRFRAAIAAAIVLAAGLLAPAATLASDGTIPTCNPTAVSVDEDQVLSDSVTCSSEEAGDTFDVVNDVADGTLTLDPNDGSYTYTPDADFNGSDGFTFRLIDPDGNSNEAAINITVNSINDDPVASDRSYTTAEDTAKVVPVPGLLTGATDVDGDSLSVSMAAPPDHGSVTAAADGHFTYTPDSNYNGSDSFTFKVTDGQGGSDTATASVTVTAVNDPPVCNDGSSSTSEDVNVTDSVVCTDVDDSALMYTVVTAPTDGSVGWNGGGPSFTYNPDANFNGTDSFEFRANDGDNNSNVATETIDVGGTNDPPVAVADGRTTNEDTQLVVNAPGVLGNDSDPDGDSLTAVLNVGPAHGSLSLSPSGGFTYTPNANYHGSDSFTYQAKDPDNESSNIATVSLTVTSVNDLPVCADGSTSTTEDTPVSDTVSCTDVDGDSLSYSVSTQPTNGTASFGSGATVTYDPDPNFNGSDPFEFQASDGHGFSDPATEAVTVSGTNDPPSFTKGTSPAVLEDVGAQTIPGWATAISPGPGDTGQTVTFVVETITPDLFSVNPAVASNGTLTFTPTANANGVSTVTLHAHDNGGGTTADGASQTFTITVTPVNDPPSFTKGQNQTVDEDSGLHTVVGWATNILEGPPDEATQVVDFVIDSDTNPLLFSVAPAVSPTGVLTYTLAPDANGVATIGLHLHDNGGILNSGDDTSATQTFTITVSGTNDPPTCVADNNATFVNASLNASIDSCVDIDADSLNYALVTQSAHGTTSVNSNGTYTYTPNANFLGNDSFTFKADDGALDSNVATMALQVQADPIARNDVAPTDFPAIMQGSGPTAIPVLANDVDKQGGPLLVQSVTQGAKGKVTITGGGTGVTYDPTGLTTGNDSFHYTIVDNQNRTNSAIVVVVITPDTIDPVVIAPMATIVSPSTLGTTTGKVRISWGASDPETGLKSIQLQEKLGTGAYRTVKLTSLKAKSALRSLTFGKVYRYRVRATDVVGNVSAWTTSPPFVISRKQESAAAIVYSGPWGLAASTSYSAGKARWATAAGASATLSFTGESVAWVSSKSTTRGSAEVYVDGVLVKTVSLKKAATTHRQVVFGTSWATAGPHTIQIVVLGTAGHPRVDLDTLVVGH